mmetsp:Transcript_88204/g.248226  ORF Transcript_88204/g.248226 Transcript_88204/m.248226 type:complete len:211 (-) Transcript_88204:428-1060(-)
MIQVTMCKVQRGVHDREEGYTVRRRRQELVPPLSRRFRRDQLWRQLCSMAGTRCGGILHDDLHALLQGWSWLLCPDCLHLALHLSAQLQQEIASVPQGLPFDVRAHRWQIGLSHAFREMAQVRGREVHERISHGVIAGDPQWAWHRHFSMGSNRHRTRWVHGWSLAPPNGWWVNDEEAPGCVGLDGVLNGVDVGNDQLTTLPTLYGQTNR